MCTLVHDRLPQMSYWTHALSTSPSNRCMAAGQDLVAELHLHWLPSAVSTVLPTSSAWASPWPERLSGRWRGERVEFQCGYGNISKYLVSQLREMGKTLDNYPGLSLLFQSSLTLEDPP
ncbi:hypothetical protein Y1Q_0019800 [Alligator mississippiensis]|uniref:Uncharacterized protein n=1 Tax=Alligator mississippiensis TaxID=8496 RepID=A0A151PF55_ALLMI|nr:hypothetical protein Y1Q_0019800 [Alligator mississippiensis]